MRIQKNEPKRIGSTWKHVLLLTCALCTLVALQSWGKENVLQVPFTDNIPSIVPYLWQSQHILAQGTLFEGLFGYAPDANGLGGVKVVPVIADTWTISPDGKVWTIKLRKDKKWSNGDPITAYDFEWSAKYLCDPIRQDVPLWANHLQHVKNGWKVKAGGASLDELGVKATDNYTIVYTLENPRFDFNCWLVVAGAMPLHKATVEKLGEGEWWKPKNFVGNGPYVPLSWTANKELVLVKNKNYVGECGNVDKIICKNYAAGLSHIQPYQAGELDMALITNVADLKYATSQAKLKNDFREMANDLMFAGYQLARGFNSDVMDNIKVRQAFAMSIDRDLLCKTVLNGRVSPAYAYWSTASSIGKKLKPIKYDVAAAKKLLSEAGYPGGKGLPALTFYVTVNMPEAEFIVDQWKKNLGVTVQIENMESTVYGQQYVWANYTPDAKPGFTRINAGMNSFETGGLTKNTIHSPLFYEYPAKVRKASYEIEQLRTDFLAKEGGLTEAEWAPLIAQKDKQVASVKSIIAKETNKYWLAEWNRPPLLADQFADLFTAWKAAKTDKEKTENWRNANRMLLNDQMLQMQYNECYPSKIATTRLNYDMVYSPFDKAIEQAPAVMQITQDQYYMVPLFQEKAQYLLRSNVSGMMIYLFSWGPLPFNFKYVNMK